MSPTKLNKSRSINIDFLSAKKVVSYNNSRYEFRETTEIHTRKMSHVISVNKQGLAKRGTND